MVYKSRICEAQVKRLAEVAKIVLITGPRQVGKSSLLAHLFPSVQSFMFDSLQDIHNVKKQADLFLTQFPPPLILDEIQFAPELLPSLKRKVDLSDMKGQYLMTGSQQLSILKSVTESLAGRVGILELGVMTPYEMYGKFDNQDTPYNSWLNTYLFESHALQQKFAGLIPSSPTVFDAIWRGGMPGTIDLQQRDIRSYYFSYLQTYIERDVRTIDMVEDLYLFSKFFSLLSVLTAQEINHTQLGREIEIAPDIAKKWLNVLRYTYQWHEIWPYHGNAIKKISKKPKGFFADSGMAAYLLRATTADALVGHPFLGALFETFCFGIIRGLVSGLNITPNYYHWRTEDGAEVDLILEINGSLYPIEVKCKTNITGHDTRGLQAFRATYPDKKIMPGLIIYAGERCYWVDENTIALPWNSI